MQNGSVSGRAAAAATTAAAAAAGSAVFQLRTGTAASATKQEAEVKQPGFPDGPTPVGRHRTAPHRVLLQLSSQTERDRRLQQQQQQQHQQPDSHFCILFWACSSRHVSAAPQSRTAATAAAAPGFGSRRGHVRRGHDHRQPDANRAEQEGGHDKTAVGAAACAGVGAADGGRKVVACPAKRPPGVAAIRLDHGQLCQVTTSSSSS
jgi:hypothetical protein